MNSPVSSPVRSATTMKESTSASGIAHRAVSRCPIQPAHAAKRRGDGAEQEDLRRGIRTTRDLGVTGSMS